MKATLRTCPNGHQFYKSSDCPTCPVCESLNKPDTGLLSGVPAPVRKALKRESIETLKQLSARRKVDLLKLHGMGPKGIIILEKSLHEAGLTFKD